MSETETAASVPPDWESECFRGAKLVEDGKLHDAAECFRALAERADIPEGTRAIMANNLATVYDKMGHVETAIQTHEYACGLMVRGFVWTQERRANFLFEHNRIADAIAVWEEILALPFVADDVVQCIEQNIAIARTKS